MDGGGGIMYGGTHLCSYCHKVVETGHVCIGLLQAEIERKALEIEGFKRHIKDLEEGLRKIASQIEDGYNEYYVKTAKMTLNKEK